MSERENLLISVATTLGGYRKDEGFQTTPEHVDKWLSQFQPDNQLSFLREFAHVMKEQYLSQEWMEGFLREKALDSNIAGANPSDFWSRAYFLNIQKNGNSQSEILKLFSGCLRDLYQLDLPQCGGEGGDFIYFDDVLFSGSRVGNDLESWLRDSAPYVGTVYIIVAAFHWSGIYSIRRRLMRVRREVGKRITFKVRSFGRMENRRDQRDHSNLLWPSFIPDTPEVGAYLMQPTPYPLQRRLPYENGGVASPFSSEAGRQVLESEFLIAGARIWANIETPKPSLRPLGFGYYGVGFGSMIVTYRNCPNNCPLAMWWGGDKSFGKLPWYPLLPRKVYNEPDNIEDASDWF